jgi:hypothetical protein
MSEKPWTPGPWIPKGPNLTPGATPDWYDAVITEYEPEPEKDDQICELGDWPEARTEQNANACLIAAAPDLVEALEALLNEPCSAETCPHDDYQTCPAEMARHALTKARGDQ